MLNNSSEIAQQLLAFGKTILGEVLFPTVIPEASGLVATDPYAFTIAVCLNRGMKTEIIWTIPYDIQQELGHLNPKLIYRMSLKELGSLFSRLPRRPRYINDAPRTLQELTRIVVEECDGDAANIWKGKRAAEVNRTFISIHGVGTGIANMGVLLIATGFGVPFSNSDRKHMDIKPDAHTKRVLYRLGISEEETEEAAITATRMLHPEFPGELDGALWEIGREWCFASNPDCANCIMRSSCSRRL